MPFTNYIILHVILSKSNTIIYKRDTMKLVCKNCKNEMKDLTEIVSTGEGEMYCRTCYNNIFINKEIVLEK